MKHKWIIAYIGDHKGEAIYWNTYFNTTFSPRKPKWDWEDLIKQLCVKNNLSSVVILNIFYVGKEK